MEKYTEYEYEYEYTKHVKYSDVFPANTGRWVGVDLVLAQIRRRWAGIGSTVVRRLVFAGKPLYVSPPYKIYVDLMTLTHGTTFLEHASIKYVTRFYCISIIYIQPHLIICTSSISSYSLHCF